MQELLLPSAPLLVLAPHPDDEILGCARLMQHAAAKGCPVVIIWLTNGGASHGLLEADEHIALISRRRAEAAQGVRALGIAPIATYHLDYPDGSLNDHLAMAKEDVERICLLHAVATVAVTDDGDSHPDHRAAHALAMGLKRPKRLLGYPVSARFEGAAYSPPVDAVRLDGSTNDAKRSALLEHRSQMEATAICPMTLATIERFCADPEYFILLERKAP
ncbi:PIG-L deacetylase family protein [Novosphingobium terrae]|uniref:PIG-L deacetylase family protein n=1 Tax=Novosphingobium terrae TaxID=2726189 RepID=UPI0019823D4F|nr:PIG-L family deacetylase [Novosphingobium terrae]